MKSSLIALLFLGVSFSSVVASGVEQDVKQKQAAAVQPQVNRARIVAVIARTAGDHLDMALAMAGKEAFGGENIPLGVTLSIPSVLNGPQYVPNKTVGTMDGNSWDDLIRGIDSRRGGGPYKLPVPSAQEISEKKNYINDVLSGRIHLADNGSQYPAGQYLLDPFAMDENWKKEHAKESHERPKLDNN